MPILGPASVAVLRLLDEVLGERASASLPTQDVARAVGLGNRWGPSSPLRRSIRRLERFGLVRRDGDDIVVPRQVPTLREGDVERLPPALQHLHARMTTSSPVVRLQRRGDRTD